MMKRLFTSFFGLVFGVLAIVSCEDFLGRTPLDTPSSETFWQSADQAEMWVNNLYNGLGDVSEAYFEGFSDNAHGRAGASANNIANGTFEPNSSTIEGNWSYRFIRLCLEFFENIEQVPDISQSKMDELSGQVRFILAYRYYKLITLYRDVPLVTEPLSIEESDVGKTSKSEVLDYILQQLDMAIQELPETWPQAQTGRITKGAALALKSRVLLYNERWAEAAEAAKQIMDSGIYELHPNFDELFVSDFNNQTDEVILARQYVEFQEESFLNRIYEPVSHTGFALVLPTDDLQASFRMEDGLPIDESPLYDPTNPFENRDPRYYDTFLWHGEELNGKPLDLTGSEFNFARTYIYFKKYTQEPNERWQSHVNWKLFRYAEVLLNYAEAKNEASGPEDSIYDALDLIRERAGMPLVDRNRYSDQESLRQLIRNERRVELAGEGLRYFDIIRWRIAEDKMNINLTSMDLSNWEDGPVDENGDPILTERPIEPRTFDPSRHYVWPIPQNAIDQSTQLEQHAEWQ
ncbi:RagB/SusD family nutrient uptake outer membrane protein [Halalkalibaculum sp. DA384]|uniref:RagB/SusD family nutrient uptake outer membrane protein n=1 Tax=Halalkalibaculum sp. DA384 TaxID=3373606 RepID=UPI003754661C